VRRLRKISGGGGGGGGAAGPRAGVPRANGAEIIDDVGAWRPLGLTFMWSLQGALNEPDRYRQNLEWAAAHGFDFKRPLYEVAWNPPLTINPGPAKPNLPTFPDHLGAIARDLDLSWSLGLRSGITLSGKGTGYDLERLARDVGDVIAAGRADRVLCVEMQNEYTNGGDPVEVLERMARAIRPKIPNMLGLSYYSPPPRETNEERDRDLREWIEKTRGVGGILFIVHTERAGDADHGCRDARQDWDLKNGRPLIGVDWEGPGPGSSGAVQNRPIILAMKRAIGIMCRGPIFVLHTGTGVYGDGHPSGSGAPRPPNFWEIENIEAIVSAIRGVVALVPAGVENWQQANTQWQAPNPVAPFQPHHHWEGDGAVDDRGNRNDGVNKAYAALAPDGRVVQMPLGVRESVRLTASYPLRDVTVYDPITLAPVPGFEGLAFPAGGVLELPGGPWSDPTVSYIIHGAR
jgi:hypothetical protein